MRDICKLTGGWSLFASFSIWTAALASSAFTPASSLARSPGTTRHSAAQAAGTRALHLCSGYYSTEAPRALIDATLFANSPLPPSDAPPPEIDEVNRRVRVTYAADMPAREAVYRDGMGCTLLPIGASSERGTRLFPAKLNHPDLDSRPWPTGDLNAVFPAKQPALEHLIDDAFKDDKGTYAGTTWGLLIVQDGRIIAERYQHGFAPHIAARTNSMCKSLGATLIGVGVKRGILDLNRSAPLVEWRKAGDPRAAITLDNLLHMASGLYSDGAQDPQIEIYQSGAAVNEVAALNVMDAVPGKRFVYAGTDNNLAMRALREALADDAAYPAFPYRELLWKIGMTRTTIETDWNNDFIPSGQCWSTARDFARLGLLYLADGVWNGERLLPEGWSRYVRTPAPVQPQKPSVGGDAGYGAQFWLYGGMEGLPSDSYAAFGALGQYAVIVPSAHLVVVRRGFDHGSEFKIQRFVADVLSVRKASPSR